MRGRAPVCRPARRNAAWLMLGDRRRAIMSGAVARPLARITHVTQAVAGGGPRTVPYRGRHDEIGALARSIAVFQDTMHRNEELNQIAVDDAQARSSATHSMSAEIARFGAEVETTLAELGRISDQMLSASAQLDRSCRSGLVHGRAPRQRIRCACNVRDIASAADELDGVGG